MTRSFLLDDEKYIVYTILLVFLGRGRQSSARGWVSDHCITGRMLASALYRLIQLDQHELLG